MCVCLAKCLVPWQVHANIRADPSPEKKERQEKPEEKKKWKQSKLTYEERKKNLKVNC